MASQPVANSAGGIIQGDGYIEPDTDNLPIDEGYEDDDKSTFTASITSSVLAYRQENGRTYHAYKEGSYLLPNDDQENDRLDMQHAVFLRSIKGKLGLAPISKNVQNVLDVGTGTGIWALDFADEFPSAEVIGTDLSPIQPSLNLKPGGYIEIQDTQFPFDCDDGTVKPECAMSRWADLIVRACKALGRPIDIAKDHKRRMEDAGFVDVVEVIHKWPQNHWPKDREMKEIGRWTMMNTLEALQALSMAPLTRGLGWSPEEVEALLVEVRKDVKDKSLHAYWPITFVYGRKPEKAKD
ncbi:hypothetical protein PRK78_006174 [Emydomyces testavorans]|uniref:Methyltransferase n=1 Tax=Emydomyces testavorans TaxID=2070801 RepID=A0AAF0ILD8_9EURO|nr:hypothetical protein PRK78_006174 [Emydomyces testavorans]